MQAGAILARMDGERLALVIFLKSAVIAAWETYSATRPDKLLLLKFKAEWDRRCAEQPLLLPDLSANRTD